MSPRNLSSGDATADRRSDYAAMLAAGGDHAAAADLMAQALDLVPGWAAGWFLKGGYCEKAGDATGAVEAYRTALSLNPEDIFGASLKLAALGAEATPSLPPSAYVEGLFDDYADRFDTALVEKLGYTVPGTLAALIRNHAGADRRFRNPVDLGCGTGLFAAAFEGHADVMEGYDLSLAMLAKARAKGLYRHLGRADLSLSPERSGLFEELPRHRADLVAAADVMMYLGDLEAAFANAAALLATDGIFAFSVEKASGEDGYELRDSLRYAHSARHVEAVLAANGLAVIDRLETVIRMDGGVPITGILFLARPRKTDG
jgi:predicted TPR repeat methyltransferase